MPASPLEREKGIQYCAGCDKPKLMCRCGSGGGKDEQSEEGDNTQQQVADPNTATARDRREETTKQQPASLRPPINDTIKLVFSPTNKLSAKELLEKFAAHEVYQTTKELETIKKLFNSYVGRLEKTEKIPTNNYRATIENNVLTIIMPNVTQRDQQRRDAFLNQLSLQGIKLISLNTNNPQPTKSTAPQPAFMRIGKVPELKKN